MLAQYGMILAMNVLTDYQLEHATFMRPPATAPLGIQSIAGASG